MFVTCIAIFVFLLLIREKLFDARHKRRRFEGVSAVQLKTDAETQASVHAVVVLDTLTEARLRTLFEVVYLQHAEFKQVPVCDGLSSFGRPRWQQAKDFRLDEHIIASDEPIDHAALRARVMSELTTGLARDRPLWRAFLFTNYLTEEGSGRSALLFKFHHCMGDGVAFMRVMMQGVESLDEPAAAAAEKRRRRRRKQPKPGLLKTLANTLAATAKLLLLPADAPSALHLTTHLTPQDPRVCDWATIGTTVAEIKAAIADSDFTVNDVLMAGLCLALRRLADDASAGATEAAANVPPPLTGDLLAVMWASLQPPSEINLPASREKPLRWDNGKLGAVYCSLPVACASDEKAGRTLSEVASRLRSLVNSPEPFIANLILKFFGTIPTLLLRPIFKVVAFKTSLSVSNLCGPQHPVRWAGSRMHEMVFMVPPQGTLGHFVTILSFDGAVQCAICSDARIVNPDMAERFVTKFFGEAVEAVLRSLYN